jgi:hypothetical protein
MTKKPSIPGILRPTAGFRSSSSSGGPRSIQDKRDAVIRSIERFLSGQKGAARLEVYDSELQAPVIRVLYGTMALPVFDGQPAAVIDPEVNRQELWNAIIERLRAGDYDQEIEFVTQVMVQSLKAAKSNRRDASRAA